VSTTLPETERINIGLRNGRLLVVTRSKAGIEVDASGVTLEVIAAGLAGEARFANQLHRAPYTVAEHSVLFSYLFGDFDHQLQALFHDLHEGVGGIGDINGNIKRVFGGKQLRAYADAVDAAVFPMFRVPYPVAEEVHRLDKPLGDYEIALLHPARGPLLEAAGKTKESIVAQFTHHQRQVIESWVNRPTYTTRAAEELWVNRYYAIHANMRNVAAAKKAVADTLALANVPGNSFWPHRSRTLVQDIANKHQVVATIVQGEVGGLAASGSLTEADGYYHVVMTPATAEIVT
jgi:hypothetical protein